MEFRPALNCWKRFTDRRGAVLLLTVYFASLLLLVIGGIALQRSMIESRAAQVSRDTQQAFYLAEAALDRALAAARTATRYDGTVYADTPVPPGYLATYQFSTLSSEVISPERQRLVRQVTAIGATPSGVTSTVTTSISEEGPLSGTCAQGPVVVMGWVGSGNPRGKFTGNIRTNLGIGWSTKLWRGLDVEGAIQLGEPDETNNTYVNIPTAPSKDPYISSIGTDVLGDPLYEAQCWNTCGVYLQGISGAVPSLSAAAYEAPLKPIPLVDPPFSNPQCQGSLVETSAAPTVQINDNGPRDLNPAVGAITLCLQYVYIEGPGNSDPKLVFNAPATIYVTSSYQPLGGSRVAFSAYDVEAVNSGNQLYPDGVKIIVTRAGAAGPGQVWLRPSRFSGSVYAPESYIAIAPAVNGSQDQIFSNLVGREAQVLLNRNHVTVDEHAVQSSPSEMATTITSWQN